jgi:heat shock protein HslJ
MRTMRAIPTKNRTAAFRFLRPRTALLGAAAALLVIAAAAVAAGCGGSADSGGSAPSLEGTAWKLTGWSISSQDPNDFTITAQFAEGRIAGTSAVNQYGGPYTSGDDGSFSVGDLVSTMMAGPEADMKAEQSYLTLLAAAKKYQVDGETLTLMDANGNESLIYTATSVASPGT